MLPPLSDLIVAAFSMPFLRRLRDQCELNLLFHRIDAVLHEFRFLPFHQLAFCFVGAALGLAGFFRDDVKFVEWNGAFRERDGFAFAAFGPGRSGVCVARVPRPRIVGS